VTQRRQGHDPDQPAPFVVSTFLLVGLVAAIISSIAVGVAAVLATDQHGGPPPGSQGFGGQGAPPPPPGMSTGEIGVTIAVALFVISWMTVILAVARDQVLRRAANRAETSELREAVQALRDEIRQYGEERETDGYLAAMRESGPSQHGTVRRLRPIPPDGP
jgi:hypothetical protein